MPPPWPGRSPSRIRSRSPPGAITSRLTCTPGDHSGRSTVTSPPSSTRKIPQGPVVLAHHPQPAVRGEDHLAEGRPAAQLEAVPGGRQGAVGKEAPQGEAGRWAAEGVVGMAHDEKPRVVGGPRAGVAGRLGGGLAGGEDAEAPDRHHGGEDAEEPAASGHAGFHIGCAGPHRAAGRASPRLTRRARSWATSPSRKRSVNASTACQSVSSRSRSVSRPWDRAMRFISRRTTKP